MDLVAQHQLPPVPCQCQDALEFAVREHDPGGVVGRTEEDRLTALSRRLPLVEVQGEAILCPLQVVGHDDASR